MENIAESTTKYDSTISNSKSILSLILRLYTIRSSRNLAIYLSIILLAF